MKKLATLLIIMAVTLFLAACGNDDDNEKEEASQEQEQSQSEEQAPLEISEEELVDENEPVAVVNGEEVKGSAYNSAYSLVKSVMYQSGQDINDLDALKGQAMDFVVEQELVMQEADEAGINIEDEEVESEFNSYKESTEDGQFETMLEQLNIDEEQFKLQLKHDLTTLKYAEQEFDVEATEEEVQEMYDQLTEQAEDQEVQELDEIREQLEGMIVEDKRQQKYAERVDELKESAEIEELI